jgi:hypothetical protein
MNAIPSGQNLQLPCREKGRIFDRRQLLSWSSCLMRLRMGAKTWMLVHGQGDPKALLKNGPAPDRESTAALVERLFAPERLQPLEDGNLCCACPPDDEIMAGCFAGLTILAAKEFALDRPSALPAKFIEAFGNGQLVLHAMHSVVDWFAFGVWVNGALVRSLSVSPDNGVIEDIGPRLPFEASYWAGAHPVFDAEEEDDYPLDFHPLELGDAALLAFFGYGIELWDSSQPDPEQIPLMRFRRKKRWWPFGQR